MLANKRFRNLSIAVLGVAMVVGCQSLPEPVIPAPDGIRLAATTAIGTCDATLNEAALTAAGWTKSFEDNFDTDLSKWNIWYGGAYNNELQLYQAPNMTLTVGILSIAAKQETVVGPYAPEDTTPRTFTSRLDVLSVKRTYRLTIQRLKSE
jgi:hypothetical protein